MGRDSATSLAPGFRFHPTDEELVRYYLKRKVSGRSFRFDPISFTDIYKSEPWDLPGKSKLKSRDLEWYFFSPLDRKYGNSSRTNRATENGYWKTTGKDRPVRHGSRTVGMKKTLVYHSGRAPRGVRSNWVMHEYRLTDENLERAGIVQDSFVLCRIFQKSGPGPKNGEKYGAPFVEEEWEDEEELTPVPAGEIVSNDGFADDVLHFEIDDIFEYLDELPSEYAQPPPNLGLLDTVNHIEQLDVLDQNDEKPAVYVDVADAMEPHRSQDLVQLPEQCGMNGKSYKDESSAESSANFEQEDVNYLLDEPYSDVPYNLALEEESYLETNDLSSPVETNPTGVDLLEEYLAFFDADDDVFQLSFDPSEILSSEDHISGQTISEKQANGAAENEFMAIKQMSVASDNDASTSNKKSEAIEKDLGSKLPFLKSVSYMLGDIPAPPAFASEFPSKDMAIRLSSAAQASSSAHTTAGVIQLRNMMLSSNAMDTLYCKNVDVNHILSFGSQQVYGNYIAPLRTFGEISQKNGVAGPRGFLFFFLLFWVLILSVSFKVGSYIYAH